MNLIEQRNQIAISTVNKNIRLCNVLLSTQIKKRQQRIRTVLEAQKLPFDVIDVAQDDVALEKMRQLVGNEEALAPQIANGDEYCGVC